MLLWQQVAFLVIATAVGFVVGGFLTLALLAPDETWLLPADKKQTHK